MYFDAKEFGKRLHDVRTSRGITQEELASKQYVSRMENGERSCSKQASYAALGNRRGIFRQNQTIRSTERLAMRVFICFSDSVRQMVRNQCL